MKAAVALTKQAIRGLEARGYAEEVAGYAPFLPGEPFALEPAQDHGLQPPLPLGLADGVRRHRGNTPAFQGLGQRRLSAIEGAGVGHGDDLYPFAQ